MSEVKRRRRGRVNTGEKRRSREEKRERERERERGKCRVVGTERKDRLYNPRNTGCSARGVYTYKGRERGAALDYRIN
jgi:hypothetical protein